MDKETLELSTVVEFTRCAVREVFVTMLDCDPEPGTAFVDPTPLLSSEVTAVVGIDGDLSGCISLHCTASQARAFASRLLLQDVGEISDPTQVRDAIAELVNVIAGRLKGSLATDLWIQTALPIVVFTSKLGMKVSEATGLAIPLTFGGETFHVELAVACELDC